MSEAESKEETKIDSPGKDESEDPPHAAEAAKSLGSDLAKFTERNLANASRIMRQASCPNLDYLEKVNDCKVKMFPGIAISTCDLWRHPVHGEAQYCEILPSGLYAVKGWYVWDNWICDSRDYDGKMHRYALTAPTTRNGEDVGPNDRHEMAVVRHAYSKDGGKKWTDTGPAVLPSGHKGTWPDYVIWSGTCILHQFPDEEKPKFVIFVTGRSEKDGFVQRIGITMSDNGYVFPAPTIILDPPTDDKTYNITDDDGIIMAWRDPSISFDVQDNQWKLFFAAKRNVEKSPEFDNKSIIPCVGQAIPSDPTWRKPWKLLGPLKMPYYAQVEMPYVIFKEENQLYYLFVSTQNNPLGSSNVEKEAAYRCYYSKTLDGAWKQVYCTDDYCLLSGDKVYGSKIYAPTIFKKQDGEFGVAAFYSEDTKYPLTCSPIVHMRWDTSLMEHPIPLFDFDKLPGLENPYKDEDKKDKQ